MRDLITCQHRLWAISLYGIFSWLFSHLLNYNITSKSVMHDSSVTQNWPYPAVEVAKTRENMNEIIFASWGSVQPIGVLEFEHQDSGLLQVQVRFEVTGSSWTRNIFFSIKYIYIYIILTMWDELSSKSESKKIINSLIIFIVSSSNTDKDKEGQGNGRRWQGMCFDFFFFFLFN